MNQPAPDLRAKCPELPPALVAAVHRALAKQPQQRYASAREMADALRQDDADQTVVLATRSRGDIAPAVAQRAELELTRFLGPIARILVKRALATARSPDDLWRTLANHIERADDRQKFMQALGPHLGSKPNFRLT